MKSNILIFPTDTVYGIGCKYDDIESIKKIREIKKRDLNKPFAILCSNINEVKTLVKDLDENNGLLKYWPGALTIVFNKSSNVLSEVTAGKNTVAIRIPNSKVSLDILKKNGPMVVTSLNESGMPPITRLEDALEYSKVATVIETNEIMSDISSTIVTIEGEVLRQGSIFIK